MNRRDFSLTIALCGSVIAHGVLAVATFEIATRQMSEIRLPGFRRAAQPELIAINDPSRVLRFGSRDGTTALSPNASDGEQDLLARDAPRDQAALSLDPRGPGSLADPPSDSLLPQKDGPTVDATAPPIVTAMVSRARPLPDDAVPFGAGAGIPRQPAARPRVVIVAPPDSNHDPASAASSKPPADPAPMSDSESDAFSTLGAIEFRDGKMLARFGRSFKSVRPRLSLAARVDLMTISQPRLVLKVSIDVNGDVTAVDVVRSSGSNQVDQPVKVAMYQWWFEPARDPKGHPMSETFLFPISWH